MTADRAPQARSDRWWLAAEWILFVVWLADAVLVMSHRRVGFFTNHAADLTMPAWLYVGLRRSRGSAVAWWKRWIVALPPASLALLLFVASTATEVCQYFRPRGPFPGTFDPLDILSYGLGVAACYGADLRWPIPPRAGADPSQDR